jgi:hypothetical protein
MVNAGSRNVSLEGLVITLKACLVALRSYG